MSRDLVFIDSRNPAEALGSMLRAAGAAAAAELRTSLENPSTPLSYPAEWLLDIWNGGRTDSGLRVSEMTSLQVTTVYACVDLVASTIGALDLNVLEIIQAADKRRGKQIAYDHALYDLLHDVPNSEMTSITFRKTLQCHMLLWGNGYAEIQRDNGNRVVALWPRNPAKTRPVRTKKGELIYKCSEGMEEIFETGGDTPNQYAPERIIEAADMLHIPGLALDGRLGSSVIHLARQAVGLALATEKFGAKFFGNGARPGGILTHPGKLSPVARETLKRSWQEAQGGENAQRAAVLEEGLKWQETSTKPDEGQFTETRQYQKGEICAIFHVPPHMIGDSEKSNRANTEQLGLEFVTFTLSPWLKSWQQELKRKCFPSQGRSANKFFAMFDTSPLTMPDAASRMSYYNSGKQWGWLSTNDIHEIEHRNPVDNPAADLYWMPINMQVMNEDAGKPAPQPSPGAQQDPDEDDEQQDQIGKRYVSVYSSVFYDAFRRVCARQYRDFETVRTMFLPVFSSIAEGFQQLASGDFGAEANTDEIMGSRFMADYFSAMAKRAAEWKEDSDAKELVRRELARAVKAISIEVYRTLGTVKAKAQT